MISEKLTAWAIKELQNILAEIVLNSAFRDSCFTFRIPLSGTVSLDSLSVSQLSLFAVALLRHCAVAPLRHSPYMLPNPVKQIAWLKRF